MVSINDTQHNGIVTYREMGRNGRLANQLFQIAATIAYGLDHNKSFVFPEWVYSKYMKKELPVGELSKWMNVPCQFHYDPIEDIPGTDVSLCNGHMQSEKYFKHHWETIKPYITIKDEYKDRILEKYGRLLEAKKKTCSIHVRLTDYQNPINIDYHGIMPEEYYRESIKALYGTENPQDVCFLIFSDNIDLCKPMFQYLYDVVFIYPDDSIVPKMKDFSGLPMGNGDLTDAFLMSYCIDHIIVNSSFGWWGAFLGEHPNKRVVAPLHWFNKAPIDYKDVVPDGWIKIDNHNLPKKK